MGISPEDAKAMTFSEYLAVCDAWARAHDTDDTPEPPSPEDYYRMVDRE